MLRLLVKPISPYTKKIDRFHNPPTTTDYKTFRQCLRWEFGFACAFCHIHELDLTPPALDGAESSGVTWIEHFVTQYEDSSLTSAYSNCFYSCKYCNRSRSKNPVMDDRGRVLLNPVDDIWEKNFDFKDFKFLPKNENARYTEESYRLNDKRKIEFRKFREELLQQAKALTGLIERFSRLIERKKISSPSDVDEIDEHIQTVRETIDIYIRQLSKFVSVPRDAKDCRCGAKLEILSQITEHIFEVDLSALSTNLI